jgi:hypothetical protein
VVGSIYVHRSVATGEIAFGRSDIDLMIIVRQPKGDTADGPELASLYEKLRLARFFNPALGHVEVHDPAGVRRWLELDSYRSSQERRSAVLLHGRAVEFPSMPVRRQDAVRRFGNWADGFFSTAVRERNRRNLRKTALEIWCAYATALGHLEEPCLTRPEIAARWAESGDAALLDDLARDPFRAPAVVFRLAKKLHDSLLPPLHSLAGPLLITVLMPPRYRRRTIVILPGAESPLPREAFQKGSSVCTPELFDLYLHYMNPFLAWVCPADLTRLGIQSPAPAAFVTACLFFGHNHTFRNPGFVHMDTWTPAAWIELVRHALPYLESERIPPPLGDEMVQRVVADRPSCSEYYRRVFPRVYQESEQQWQRLKRLETSCALP